MFNLSFGELIILGAIGLIVIGPKQLPQLAKILGRTIGELKKAMNEVTSTVSLESMGKTEEKIPDLALQDLKNSLEKKQTDVKSNDD